MRRTRTPRARFVSASERRDQRDKRTLGTALIIGGTVIVGFVAACVPDIATHLNPGGLASTLAFLGILGAGSVVTGTALWTGL